ncbi:MAG TPA: TIGR01777 family oxidoreductase [Polyangia bacterium]
MRVVLAGATGCLGRALVLRLAREGHVVTAAVRSVARARAVLGADVTLVDLAEGERGLADAVAGADAVINLSGEPIAGGRWTERRRTAIVESRVGSTERLVAAIAAAPRRPRVLINASAVGYYGDRGDELLDETSAPGTGFLAETCVAWEAAAQRAEPLGVRVVRLRFGVVMGLGGGFLDRLLPLVRMGLGARLGNGRQWMPWIHLDDLADLVVKALVDDRYTGAIDAVAPGAVRLGELMEALGRSLGRDVGLAVPAVGLRLALGEAADVVLGGQQLRAARLGALGFQHRFPDIDGAFANLADRIRGVAIEPLSAESPAPLLDTPYLQRGRPTHLLRSQITLDAPIDEVFAFFSRPENLGIITPAAMAFRIVEAPRRVEEGSVIDYDLRIAGAAVKWRTHIARWRPGEHFVDTQERGPYRCWWHEHHFSRAGAQTMMEDRVYFALPWGPLGAIARGAFVSRQLRDVFGYRGQAIGLRFRESGLPGR